MSNGRRPHVHQHSKADSFERLKTAMKSLFLSSDQTLVSKLLIRLLAPLLHPLFSSKTAGFKTPHLKKTLINQNCAWETFIKFDADYPQNDFKI